MSVNIRIPTSIWPGFYRRFRRFRIGIFAHNLQCDRRWIFLIGTNMARFGYLTKGDSEPGYASYDEAGWFFPWKKKLTGGRI